MANKSRPHAVMCRMNDKELARYKELLSESGMKSQDFIKKAITTKRFTVVKKTTATTEIDGLGELIFQLKKVGTNLNQIAKELHESKYYSYNLITQNQKEVAELIKQLQEKLGGADQEQSIDDMFLNLDEVDYDN